MTSSGRVTFSVPGRRDIRMILRRTVDTWGEDRGRAYKTLLDAAFLRLSEYPLLGRRRDDVRPGLRSIAVGQHIVLYRIEGEEVVVVRVEHGRRDIARIALP